ncbi:MAG TPA: SDR family oxidoreductase [Anaerolineales bacterium]|nr:SDR family oxidoreductase [Anaerolineales bacterium]
MKVMKGILAGKVAVITGGTRGIGLAIAEAYARQGAHIAVSSRSAEAVKVAVEGLRDDTDQVIGQVCDVRDRAQIQELSDVTLQHYHRIDIWVNNAGISGPYGPTIEISPERFAYVVHTNILGVYYGSMTAVLQFSSQNSGKLINVVGRGARGPVPYQNAYASSKAWVRSFTLALAEELEESGIGVYVLSPGMALTDMLQRPEVVEGNEGRLGDRYKTVLRMWSGPPDNVGEAAVWLASPATDGRTAIDRRLLTPPRLIAGMLGEAARRLLGRASPSIEVSPTIIPAWKPPSSRREE